MTSPIELPSDTRSLNESTLDPSLLEVPVVLAGTRPSAGSSDDPGGEADTDSGPESGLDTEPSVASLRAEILEKVAASATAVDSSVLRTR